ncbi:MAG: hypothetical protein Hyperionvirus14_2 [Hyperionvirus sp.]|uniref:Ankyrin repeat protein n=1 Tax=Hyperionvirus sp. TaxID=2487770 RepID=A0A3G5ADE4_9VIRU|nr:MAG: hypothetical protein Hyperionvirus14_2 [Hyperionvirus sp.]
MATHQFRLFCETGQFAKAVEVYEKFAVDIHEGGEYVFRKSCANGHFEIVSWLVSLGADINVAYNEPFKNCCTSGHLELAKWLKGKGHMDIDVLTDAFRYTCGRGHLDVVQWLYGYIDYLARDHLNGAFVAACWFGHLEIAKWLFSLGAVELDYDNFDCFRKCCWFGHLEIAQWLWSLGGIDTHAENEEAFRYSCWNGELEVVKWLWSLGGIDLTGWVLQSLLILSINKGQLDVIKWVHSLGVNLGVGDYMIFKLSCTGEKNDVVKWFLSVQRDIPGRIIEEYADYYGGDVIAILYNQGYVAINPVLKKKYREHIRLRVRYYKTLIRVSGVFIVKYFRVCHERYKYGGEGFLISADNFKVFSEKR